MIDETEEAIAAYWRQRRRQGYEDWQIPQPSRYSQVLDNRIILTNVRGYLGTYHLGSHRMTWSERDKRLVG